MSENIYIQKPVLITSTSAIDVKYLVTKLNHLLVGVPLYKFANSYPDIDFIQETNINIDNGTFTNLATTSYVPEMAVALTTGCRYPNPPVYSESVGSDTLASCTFSITSTSGIFAFPFYKIDQKLDSSYDTGLEFENATLVSNLSATDTYYVVQVNGERYGIPAVNYNSVYPNLASWKEQSDINVTTLLNITPTINNTTSQTNFAGSTNLNSKIKTYADLIKRIKMQLGWPIVQVEGCDEQIVDFIDQAIEWYTKYAGYTEEFLLFDSNLYRPGIGIKMDDIFTRLYCMQQIQPSMSIENSKHTDQSKYLMDYDLEDYRKVVNVFSWDEAGANGGDFLFSMEYIFAQQTYFSYVLGNYGFDLVSWHILKDWIDTRERMFALKRRFEFNDRTQMLKLLPEPITGQRFIGIIGAYVEKPIKDLIMERWIYKYALALTKIQVGNVRGKFGAVQLFGGGTVSIEIGAQGLAEQEKLEAELMDSHGEVPPIKFFIG